MKVSGSFAIDDMDLRLGKSNVIDSLSGTVRWEGGSTRYIVGDETRVAPMPPMVGELSSMDADAVLSAVDEDNVKLLQVRLETDTGWIHVSLSRRMLELSQMPWDTDATDDTEVLNVSREVF